MAKSLLNQEIPKKNVPPFRTIRCPMVGHQVSWCRGLCEPMGDRGLCGRKAPHKMIGKTQEAIRNYYSRLEQGSCAEKSQA